MVSLLSIPLSQGTRRLGCGFCRFLVTVSHTFSFRETSTLATATFHLTENGSPTAQTSRADRRYMLLRFQELGTSGKSQRQEGPLLIGDTMARNSFTGEQIRH